MTASCDSSILRSGTSCGVRPHLPHSSIVASAIRHLATFRAYIDREIDARHVARVMPSAPMRDPTAPANAEAQNAVPDKSDAEIETAKQCNKSQNGLFCRVFRSFFFNFAKVPH